MPGYSGDGGPATEARIGKPQAICITDDDVVYFADSAHHVIRKIDADGVITTVAGVGEAGFSPDGTPAAQAKIAGPQGVAVAPDGTVYFADTRNSRVRRIAADGTLETVAGGDAPGDFGDGGPATDAGLNEPHGIALYGGVLLISDYLNNKLRAVKLPKG